MQRPLFYSTMCALHVHLFSCRTVEVNNTDAEGRLVLGDGVRQAYMYEYLNKKQLFSRHFLEI